MPHPVAYTERKQWEDKQYHFLQHQKDPAQPKEMFGMRPRFPDPRDVLLAEADPRICEVIAAGLPDGGDLSRFVVVGYNQGQIPACVSHTLAGGQSAQQMQEEGVRRVFDAMRAHNETGPVNQGRYPDQMMRYWKDTGLAEVGTGKKFHLENYAWIMNGPNWFDEICAAIVLEKFLGMAYLVPQYFSYESDGDITSGYHESLLCGFRRGANAGLLGKNSWGDNWGRNGFFWLSKKYLESHNFHNGLIIVHSLVSVKESGPTPPPPPPPPPPPVTDKEAESFRLVNDYRRGKGLGLLVVDERLARAARKHSQDMAARGYESHTSPDGTTPISRMQAEGVTANAYGENIGWGQSTAEQVHNEWLASPGHKANLDFAAFNKIGVGYHAGGRFGHYWTHNFVFIPNGGPPPPPQTLKVTGYQPAEVASGKNFQILGQGFGVGVLFVSWGGQVLVVNRGGDTTITATAPIVTEARTAAVAVRLEGATAEGPPLTIRPEPPPDDGPVIERLEPPEAERGEGVTVVGKQFGSTGGRIFVVGAEAPALNWGPTRAHFLVPGAAALGQSFVELRRADGKSFTASFTVLENSPPPTDDLVVQGVARFYGRGLCYVWAYVRDKAGMYVKGKVEGTLGDLVLPSRLTGGVTTWALRNANFPHQVRLTLTARSGDRSGTFSGEF